MHPRAWRWFLGAAVLAAAMSACEQPFGLGLPAEPALERGAANTLGPSGSFEMSGAYTTLNSRWQVDLKVARPAAEHVTVTSSAGSVEAVIIGGTGYFRGHDFLARHMGTDPPSQSVVNAAGNAWWKGAVGLAPQLPDLTDGATFRATFLGSAAVKRTDHVEADGVPSVELSGQRADVFIAASPPYHLVRVVLRPGVAIDGVTDADLHYSNAGRDFGIVAPNDVLDFSNLSTLPPIYTVTAVDTSGCVDASQCLVSAQLKNLGGLTGAKAPSTVRFEMRDAATNQLLGSCTAVVLTDVGYNSTTTVSCTLSGQATNAANVTATVTNPGRSS
jgi:hypothetical protein